MTTREDVQAWLDRLELPVESAAEDIWVVRTEEGAEVTGQLTTAAAAEGSSVVIHMTLLGSDGQTIGEGDITVTAPAEDTTVEFQGALPASGDIAGWRYEIRG